VIEVTPPQEAPELLAPSPAPLLPEPQSSDWDHDCSARMQIHEQITLTAAGHLALENELTAFGSSSLVSFNGFKKQSLTIPTFPAQVSKNVTEPGGIASRVREVIDEPHGNGVAHAEKHNRNG
jgi:hypothetical protein